MKKVIIRSVCLVILVGLITKNPINPSLVELITGDILAFIIIFL